MDYTQNARDNLSRDRYALETTGIVIDEVGEGYAKCSLKIEDKHLNCGDNVMGGAIFTLVDFTFGASANTPQANCITLNAQINFLRGASGPVIYAEAKCLKDGRNIAFYEVVVTDSAERVIARATVDGFRYTES